MPGSLSSSNRNVLAAWKTPIGWIRVSGSDGRVDRLTLVGGGRPTTAGHRRIPLHAFRRELDRYFSGTLTRFSSKTSIPGGTAFERKVWRALTRIPYGETRTYGWIAEQIGHPGAHRAVGRACGNNPLPVVIPCHRVIRASGELGGYTGGIGIKRRLLELERGARRKYRDRSPAARHADAIAVPGDRTTAAKR